MMAKVLVVDDNKEGALTMVDFLRSSSFECFLATKGSEALEMLDDAVDLAILDLDLPDISGFELMRLLRLKNPNVGFILVSANQNWEIESKAYELGAYRFFQKPIELGEFLKAVKSYFDGGER